MESQTSKPVGAELLPDSLPPFEIAAALARLEGNRTLLRRLIVGFADRFENAVSELRRLVREDAWSAAERLAHSVKGSAAQIEARALAADAALVEQACRDRRATDLPGLIAAFEARLAPAIAAARALPRLPTPAPPPGTIRSADGQPLVALIAELKSLLGANSLRARRSFAQLQAALAGAGRDDALARMAQCIDKLEFTEALRILDALSGPDGGSGPRA